MKNGPIPLAVHAMAEPFLALAFIAAPFVLGFNDDSEAATALSIGAGVLVAIVSMLTNWRLALARVVPLPVHAMADLGLGAFLVVSPFLLGFSDDSSAATLFFVLMGLGLIGSSIATRWTHDTDVGGRGGDRFAERKARKAGDRDERFDRDDRPGVVEDDASRATTVGVDADLQRPR